MTDTERRNYDSWRESPPCEREEYNYACVHACPYYHSDCWGDYTPDIEEDE